MSYSHIKGIIFDLGSTLIEFESRSWDVLASEGQRLAYDSLNDADGLLPDFDTFNNRLEDIKNQFRIKATETLTEWRSTDAFELLLAELGINDAREQGRRCMDAFYDVVRDGLVLCEGALETLEELKRLGFRTGLISNTIFPRRAHEVDLDNFGLTPYIDFRLYSSEFGFRKPHPGIYEEGLKLIGLPGEDTIFVGDRLREDVEGPEKAGMSGVLIYRQGRDYPDPPPDGLTVIYKITELLNLLDTKK